MFEVRQTVQFDNWLTGLRDAVTIKAVRRRIARIQIGLFGDTKAVGEGVSELRIDHGPGYRVYFARRDKMLILLLWGGDKGSQTRDITRARALLAEWTQ